MSEILNQPETRTNNLQLYSFVNYVVCVFREQERRLSGYIVWTEVELNV